ncbi:MAG: efflux transporter outer membrane subunit [Planctomycetota bacterium]|jgi:NodT family efflux transporter outer membrane factor (OMF) lipoprotein|nr:efflux transporter outer membrane subunit [Planctomycetota bacterium]
MLAILLCAGCIARQGNSVVLPAPPRQWSGELAQDTAPQNWLADFTDEQLPLLVQEALKKNWNLRLVAARLQAAGALARIEGASVYPDATLSLDASKSERIFNSGAVRRTIKSTDFGLNLRVVWEADIWGKLRDERRAANQDFQAAQADFAAARLSLAALVARGWFETIAARRQVELAVRTVESFEKSLAAIRGRARDGALSVVDYRLGKAEVASAKSRLEARHRVLDATRRVLETVLGRYPSAELKVAAELPAMSAAVPAGLPSQLLGRRPDMVSAAIRLEASRSRLKGERKNRLPALRLTGNGGTSTDALQDILNFNFLVWNIAAALTQPVFNAGRLKAKVALAEAQEDQAIAEFAGAALIAFREVETALKNEEYLKKQEVALRQAVEESKAAEAKALEDYSGGLVEIITLLTAQRRTFQVQSELIAIQSVLLENRVALYLALGGGFEA